MAGVSTGVSLLGVSNTFVPRTLNYTATTTPSENIPISNGTSQMYLSFLRDGRVATVYGWSGSTASNVIGNWASPTGNPNNPENFSLRMTYISGLSPNQSVSSSVFDVWHDGGSSVGSEIMQCEVNNIPAVVGTYSITFRVEIRDSNLTTQINTVITLSTVRS